MPVIGQSSYEPPWFLPGGHLQTIYPALFRRVPQVTTLRERLELEDGDFLDLAWSGKSGGRLAILTHGLENRLETEYIQGMAAALARRGWDVLAWTFRGCGDEPNRLFRMYHSGATGDLDAVVRHAIANHQAGRADLVGFSLGGNLTLKYLGEPEHQGSHSMIGRAVAISVPCDLACSARALARFSNILYMERFLRKMRARIRRKDRMFPGRLDLTGLGRIRNFQDFDDRYTAPIHGFKDAEDYWSQCGCRRYLAGIRMPVLLLNAMNDPFLGPGCYPFAEAAASEFVHFETPAAGGHVGFAKFDGSGEYWSERRAAEFLGGG
jgi:uncharacterized protein